MCEETAAPQPETIELTLPIEELPGEVIINGVPYRRAGIDIEREADALIERIRMYQDVAKSTELSFRDVLFFATGQVMPWNY